MPGANPVVKRKYQLFHHNITWSFVPDQEVNQQAIQHLREYQKHVSKAVPGSKHEVHFIGRNSLDIADSAKPK